MTQSQPNRIRRPQNPINVFRVGIIGGIIGIVMIALGLFIYVTLDRGSRQRPLDIPLYQGATQWGAPKIVAPTNRRTAYIIPGATPEDVVAFYEQQLRQHYGGDATADEVKCKRNPLVGNFPDFDAGRPGVAAYQFTCHFSRDYLDMTQYTTIYIQPGIASDDPLQNALGSTVIEYVQVWTP